MMSTYIIKWPITSCLGGLSEETEGTRILDKLVEDIDTTYVRNNIDNIILAAIISNVSIDYKIDQVYYEEDLPCLSGKSTIKIITLRELTAEEEMILTKFFSMYIIDNLGNWLIIFDSDFYLEKIE